MDDARRALDELIQQRGVNYSSVSRLLGRNAAYIQQYIRRGSPRQLDEQDRSVLARFFGVDEKILGAPARRSGPDPAVFFVQLLLSQHDARHVGVHRVDFTHRPFVERLGDHHMEQVENFHDRNGCRRPGGSL